jgi:hypothetical protein
MKKAIYTEILVLTEHHGSVFVVEGGALFFMYRQEKPVYIFPYYSLRAGGCDRLVYFAMPQKVL